MKTEQFWQIIDTVNQSMGNHDQETYFCRIMESLLHYKLKDIVDWQKILNEYTRAAYRGDLWDESHALGAHATEKEFSDFRLWLVSRGKDAYLSVLWNPAELAVLVQTEEPPRFEKLEYAAYYAYEAKLLQVDPTRQEDLFSAMGDVTLDAETIQDIWSDIPPAPAERQSLSAEDMDKLLESKHLAYGYVYQNGVETEYLVDGTPENLAHFLGCHPDADKILITDVLDRFILDTFGNFINRCPDQSLLAEIKETLIPIQRGEIEARRALCATTDAVDAYYAKQEPDHSEMGFSDL